MSSGVYNATVVEQASKRASEQVSKQANPKRARTDPAASRSFTAPPPEYIPGPRLVELSHHESFTRLGRKTDRQNALVGAKYTLMRMVEEPTRRRLERQPQDPVSPIKLLALAQVRGCTVEGTIVQVGGWGSPWVGPNDLFEETDAFLMQVRRNMAHP
jgi:hypothetical protein